MIKQKVSRLAEEFAEKTIKGLNLDFPVWGKNLNGDEAFSEEAQCIYNDFVDLMDRLIINQ